MEERILDDEEGRGIRLKRTKDGATDAVEDLGEGDEEELVLEFSEEELGELDEDLVGLTPSQLQEELERREKARQEALEESRKLIKEGDALLERGNFAEATLRFEQAMVYDPENEEIIEGLWKSRTKDFTELEALLTAERAEEVVESATAHKYILSRAKSGLQSLREERFAEVEVLRPEVEGKRAERRAAFAANRKYYLIRSFVTVCLLALFVIGIAISADSILRTQSITPIVLTIVFGVLAFVALVLSILTLIKLYGANRLCIVNERASSTESGARLALLEEQLEALAALLDQ